MLRLKELRKEKGITLKELSRILKERYNLIVSDGQLSNYENEKRRPRDESIWNDIAEYFGVDVAYLLGYQDERYLFKDTVADEPTSEIQSLYDKLNNDNQGKLLDYGHLLLRDQQKTKFDNISDESIKKVRSSGNEAHQRIMDRIENQRRKNEKR
ncbi:helix-turn-helix transcriptional regulator [Streptococcus pluranimalium]|uniref:helix-turn-helix domain-containing protein n=1 Tax=Streptococcus pluranimalium TaxID=82348 RepID=UPI0031389F00